MRIYSGVRIIGFVETHEVTHKKREGRPRMGPFDWTIPAKTRKSMVTALTALGNLKVKQVWRIGKGQENALKGQVRYPRGNIKWQ